MKANVFPVNQLFSEVSNETIKGVSSGLESRLRTFERMADIVVEPKSDSSRCLCPNAMAVDGDKAVMQLGKVWGKRCSLIASGCIRAGQDVKWLS